MCFYCEGLQLHTFSHKMLIKAMYHLSLNLIFYGFLLLFSSLVAGRSSFPSIHLCASSPLAVRGSDVRVRGGALPPGSWRCLWC